MRRQSKPDLPKVRGWLAVGLLAAGPAVGGCSSPAEQVAQPAGNGTGGTSTAAAGADTAPAGSAGVVGTAGAPGGTGGQAAGGAGGEPAAGGTAGAAGATATCELAPEPQVTSATAQQFAIELTFDGEPFARGDVVTIGERAVTLSTFLFFLSQASLVQGTQEMPVDLVGADATLEPYGVHLFDLENTSSYSFVLHAPQGNYDGLKFAVGLAPACNGGNPADRMAPLNASSPMNWTWGFGYMFLRLEGTHAGPADLEPISMQVHGGAIGAVEGTGEAFLSIPGAFTVGAGAAVPLQLDLRPILELAATQGDHLAGGRVMLDALPTLDFISLPTP